MMRPDLHVHTTFSDGSYTPAEMVQAAKQAGLSAVAITDHDECRGYGEIIDEQDITVCPGIELAARFNCEVHVLGLQIDWKNQKLIRHIENASEARRHRAKSVLEKLQAVNVDIDMQHVVNACEGDVIGRPHLAKVLVDKGYASSYKEAFVRYLAKDACCYVPLDKINVRNAADLILQAGGKPILAHPGLLRGRAFEQLVPKLKDMGFWGIEAYHPAHSNGHCREYETIAKNHGLYVTAGSDFHGAAKPKVKIGQEQRGGKYLEKSLEELDLL